MPNMLQNRYKSTFGMRKNRMRMDCSPPFIAYTEPSIQDNLESLILKEAEKLGEINRDVELEYNLTVVISDVKLKKKTVNKGKNDKRM